MRTAVLTMALAGLPLHLPAADVAPLTRPPGAEASTKTTVLKAGYFCSQVNEDFAQCVLFDGNTREANLAAPRPGQPGNPPR